MAAVLPRRRAPAARAATSPRTLDQGGLQRLIGYNLRRAEVQMRGLVARALGEEDIRAVEYSILSLIAANSEVTQKDLGEALSVKRPNMVSLIERLEKRSLIARKVLERDRRNHVLTLTDAGGAMLARMDARLDTLEDTVFRAWTPGERLQIVALLRRIYEGS